MLVCSANALGTNLGMDFAMNIFSAVIVLYFTVQRIANWLLKYMITNGTVK